MFTGDADVPPPSFQDPSFCRIPALGYALHNNTTRSPLEKYKRSAKLGFHLQKPSRTSTRPPSFQARGRHLPSSRTCPFPQIPTCQPRKLTQIPPTTRTKLCATINKETNVVTYRREDGGGGGMPHWSGKHILGCNVSRSAGGGANANTTNHQHKAQCHHQQGNKCGERDKGGRRRGGMPHCNREHILRCNVSGSAGGGVVSVFVRFKV